MVIDLNKCSEARLSCESKHHPQDSNAGHLCPVAVIDRGFNVAATSFRTVAGGLDRINFARPFQTW